MNEKVFELLPNLPVTYCRFIIEQQHIGWENLITRITTKSFIIVQDNYCEIIKYAGKGKNWLTSFLQTLLNLSQDLCNHPNNTQHIKYNYQQVCARNALDKGIIEELLFVSNGLPNRFNNLFIIFANDLIDWVLLDKIPWINFIEVEGGSGG